MFNESKIRSNCWLLHPLHSWFMIAVPLLSVAYHGPSCISPESKILQILQYNNMESNVVSSNQYHSGFYCSIFWHISFLIPKTLRQYLESRISYGYYIKWGSTAKLKEQALSWHLIQYTATTNTFRNISNFLWQLNKCKYYEIIILNPLHIRQAYLKNFNEIILLLKITMTAYCLNLFLKYRVSQKKKSIHF